MDGHLAAPLSVPHPAWCPGPLRDAPENAGRWGWEDPAEAALHGISWDFFFFFTAVKKAFSWIK